LYHISPQTAFLHKQCYPHISRAENSSAFGKKNIPKKCKRKLMRKLFINEKTIAQLFPLVVQRNFFWHIMRNARVNVAPLIKEKQS